MPMVGWTARRWISIPRIRSERPAFDLHHPEVGQFDAPVADQKVLDTLLGGPDVDPGGAPGPAGRSAPPTPGSAADDERGDTR